MKKPLLRDPAAQAALDERGYAIISLFSADQVASLLELYHRHVASSDVAGLYESSRHKSYDENQVINDAIRAEVEREAPRLFLPARIYGGTFMVKASRCADVLPLHQDWSVVEEDEHETLFLWCPLQDTAVENGGLFVLPGSDRWFDGIRAGSYPSDRFILPAQLSPYVVDLSLSAGEAVLYRDRLFHGSHANDSARDRIVVTARLVEEGAPLVYFHKASETEVDVFEASPELYLTHIDALAKGRMPAGVPKLRRRPYRHVPVTSTSLAEEVRRRAAPRTEPARSPRLFRDAALEDAFHRDGFVVLDLLPPERVRALRAFHDGLDHGADLARSGFRVSLDHEDPSFVRNIAEHLLAAVRADIEAHFVDHRLFTASFVSKGDDPNGLVPPHQDWTFVDESRFWSATIWCPLVDVHRGNGALGVIKGSHRLYDHVRPSPSPHFAPPFRPELDAVFPFLQLLELPAGRAVVFDNRTIHGSPPNETRETRLAFGVGITHRDADLLHYYLLPGRSRPEMAAYRVEPEHFFELNNARLLALHEAGTTPNTPIRRGTFTLEMKSYSRAELQSAFRSAGNVEDAALAELVRGRCRAAFATRPAEPAGTDDRTFWEIYTPGNVMREIAHRVRNATRRRA